MRAIYIQFYKKNFQAFYFGFLFQNIVNFAKTRHGS